MQRPRGFVILVVLLILAVMSAVVAGQLNVVRSESAVSVRREEDAQARAIAEGCLQMLFKYAERYQVDTPGVSPTAPSKDFDALLNPTGAAAGRFVPAGISGSTVVQIPSGANNDHNWLYVPRDGGACFLRFEDNSDDSYPAVSAIGTSCTSTPAEGTGVEVNFCDRDGQIYMTAIGVFPANTATTAYSNAHARVTLRKLFQVAAPSTFPPGLASAGDIDIKNNIRMCGVGGIAADDFNGKLKGTSCLCGSVTVDDPLTSQPPLSATCAGCTSCDQGSARTGQAAPRPIDIDGDNFPCAGPAGCAQDGAAPNESGLAESPWQPDRGGIMANQNFGPNPRAGFEGTLNNMGDAAICKFYMETDGTAATIFVWDRTDGDPAATMTGRGATSSVIPSDNCATYTSDPVGQPCTWNGSTITCSGTQTACWKPIARLNELLAPPENPFLTGPSTGAPEMSDSTGDYLRIGNGIIPNVADTSMRFGAASAATRLCGLPPSDASGACANCQTGAHRLIRHKVATETFVFDAPETSVGNADFPVPAVLVTPDDFGSDEVVGDTKPFLVGLVSASGVNLDPGSGLCCPSCGCSEMIAASTRTLTSGTAGQCNISSPANVAPPSPFVANSLLPTWARYFMPDTANYTANNLPPAAISGDNSLFGALPANRAVPGFVVRTNGPLAMGVGSTLVGLAWTSSSFAPPAGGACVVGRLVVDNSVAFPSNASMNVAGEWLVTGNVGGGNVNNVVVNAELYTEGNVNFKNNWAMNGRLFANGDISFKNNAIINYFGGGSTGSFGSDALNNFMESQW